jgi:hypothetical protein
MIKYLDKIRNEIPFGGSPLYDAIVSGAEILLSDDLDIYSKSIYINSDNEENLSINTADSAIAEVQSIDGFGKTPVIINNFSIVFPLTLSALLSRTDTDSLDKIAIGTNGQSQTILDANYLNESLNNSLGKMTGSLGWGLYECIVDLGKNSIINNIKLDYELFSNTDGNWKVAVSEDGLNYSDYTEFFNSNTSIEFANLNAQYLKFYVTLFSGLSASIENEYDLVPSPGVPALTGINIEYNIPKESFIYLNKENTIYSPQQISVSISANKPLLSSIEVGASTSNSFNWSQYYSGAQPLSDRHGKIVIPIRYSQNLSDYNEPLENVDGYMWKTKYGRWDSNAKIVIKTTDGVIVSSSLYKSYPDDGIIIFNSKQNDKMYISIENSAEVKLGIRVLNMDHNNPVSITGIGYMYNSNVFLPPPLSQRAPIVSQFNILPKEITVYSPISLNYIYFNINLKEEEKEKSEIRWYINGVEIEFLRNLRSWNNINDINDPIWIYAFSFKSSEIPSGTSIERYARERGESIIKVGDTLHATIRVSDGLLFSDTARSPSIKVIESPPFVTRLTIKGKRNDGLVQNNITSATRAFLDFDYFQDDKSSSKSQVIWYVNGIEFKRGFLNASVGGISNNEILVGEIKNNIVGISIGNVLEATIVPASENIIGNPITSSPVSVENDLPVIRNVIISPNPKVSSSSSLQLTYLYVDNESQQQGSTQNDQSSIRWLKSPRGSNEFVEVSALQNVRIVQSVNISAGEKWKAEVIPFDGLSVGLPVQSNTVEIV